MTNAHYFADDQYSHGITLFMMSNVNNDVVTGICNVVIELIRLTVKCDGCLIQIICDRFAAVAALI